MMTDEDLIQLREVFRIAFKQHDFCIGEEEVERVFRILLEEPEPEDESNHNHENISLDEAWNKMDSKMDAATIEKLFNIDDAFYTKLRKK
jgi:Ca2+-binding EF-hand superfamily protein